MIFFQKNPSLFFFEEVRVREDWLVSVNLFYKVFKSKKKLFFFYYLGAGEGGR